MAGMRMSMRKIQAVSHSLDPSDMGSFLNRNVGGGQEHRRELS
jgi:hypothetical protein